MEHPEKKSASGQLAGTLAAILAKRITDPEKLRQAKEGGLSPRQTTNGGLMALALVKKAQSGDISAIREIRSILEPTGGTGTVVINIHDDL
ncbi:MAG: hypothetical protein IJY82_03250 [Oscillospiraceae bacterium]|nr:hypothetical protein [Oscillospiraceae bacterium]MBQ8731824.1 hypothetical protein [Oscillospiraceae bacterium]